MKNPICAISTAVALFGAVHAFGDNSTPKGFTDNLDAALAAAKADGKYVYVCFSGSDWCGWCVKLESEVFSKDEFLDGVTNDYHLVFIDSPNDEELISERARVENPKLVEKYGINGYPTALVLDSDGTKIVTTGYRAGGPQKYAEYLKDVRADAPGIIRRQKLASQFIEPFRTKMEGLSRDNINAIEAAFKAGKDEGLSDADIEKKIASEIITPFIVKCRAVVKEFESADAPEEIARQKAKELNMAKQWLDALEKSVKARDLSTEL